MGRRRKNPVKKPPLEIYDLAYSIQDGEFYPERHIVNVQKLTEKFPDYSPKEVDEIYRTACRIDDQAEAEYKKLKRNEIAQEQALESLEKQFYGFTRKSFSWALEKLDLKSKR